MVMVLSPRTVRRVMRGVLCSAPVRKANGPFEKVVGCVVKNWPVKASGTEGDVCGKAKRR